MSSFLPRPRFQPHDAQVRVTRPYQQLSAREDFQLFIRSLLQQMGLEKEDVEKLEQYKAMDEFAKCFITVKKDPEYNYELYELAGDVCINSAIVLYIHRIVQNSQDIQQKQNPLFLPDPRLNDYFQKLKSKYISNPFYDSLAKQLGFHTFIQYSLPEAGFGYGNSVPPNKDKYDDPQKPDAKYIPSVLEAFFGCFEFNMNTMMKHEKDPHKKKYSHAYVSSFISYLMNSIHIDYHPDSLYDPVTLLKETNDQLKKNDNLQKSKEQDGLPTSFTVGYTFETRVSFDKRNSNVEKVYSNGEKVLLSSVEGTSKEKKSEACKEVLKIIKNDPQYRTILPFLKNAPTPNELGIEQLC